MGRTRAIFDWFPHHFHAKPRKGDVLVYVEGENTVWNFRVTSVRGSDIYCKAVEVEISRLPFYVYNTMDLSISDIEDDVLEEMEEEIDYYS